MVAFLLYFCSVGILLFLSSFVETLTSIHYLAIPIWFLAVTLWTVEKGFHRSILFSVPFLFLVDVLWDGKIGLITLCGFGLLFVLANLKQQLETNTSLFSFFLKILTTAFFSFLVVMIPIFWDYQNFNLSDFWMVFSVFFGQLVTTIIFFSPLQKLFSIIDSFLDTSQQDLMRKIR